MSEVTEAQIAEELIIRTPQLNELLETQAARLAYWGSVASRANKIQRQAKTRAEVIEAQLKAQARSNWPEGWGQKSENAIMTIVRQDPQWTQVWNEYYEAKEKSEILQVAKEAFSQRKDLLVTISANLRGEMSGQVRIREKAADQVTPYVPASVSPHQRPRVSQEASSTPTTKGATLQQKINLFTKQVEGDT